METAFTTTVTTVETPQPSRNLEPTPNPPLVHRPFCGGVCECSTPQFLSVFVVLLIVAFYLSFLIFWIVSWQKHRP